MYIVVLWALFFSLVGSFQHVRFDVAVVSSCLSTSVLHVLPESSFFYWSTRSILRGASSFAWVVSCFTRPSRAMHVATSDPHAIDYNSSD